MKLLCSCNPNTIISIHALREESDIVRWLGVVPDCVFQSTLSVRRATVINTSAKVNSIISIHALREESDAYDRPRSP